MSSSTDAITLAITGFTLESPRETVGGPAALFLLVSLFGVRDVYGLAGGHVCKDKGGHKKSHKTFL